MNEVRNCDHELLRLYFYVSVALTNAPHTHDEITATSLLGSEDDDDGIAEVGGGSTHDLYYTT